MNAQMLKTVLLTSLILLSLLFVQGQTRNTNKSSTNPEFMDGNTVPKKQTNESSTIRDFTYGHATLKGKIIGHVPKENDAIEVRTGDPITGAVETYLLKVAKDGSFEGKIPLISTRNILFEYLGIVDNIFLSVNQETSVNIDIEKHTQAEKDKSVQYIHFEGANAAVNNELFNEAYTKIDMSNPSFDKKFSEDIKGMTPIEYRDYLYTLEEKKLKEIAALNISENAKSILEHEAKYITLINLCNGDRELRAANKSENYEEPHFDKQYYARLKDFPVDDMIFDYSGITSYFKDLNKLIPMFYESLFEDNYDEMIELGLVGETDIEIVELLKATAPLKAKPEIKAEDIASNIKTFEVLKREGLLKGKKLHIAEELSKMTTIKTDREFHKYSILTLNFIYPSTISDSLYNRLGINPIKIPDSVTDSVLLNKMKKLNEDDPTLADRIEIFLSTNKQCLDNFKKLNHLELKLELFKEIAEVNKGPFLDMMYTQFFAERFNDLKPLTEVDFVFLKDKIDNPFYIEQLIRKNNEVLAKVSKNTNYNVYEVPKEDEDKLLYEIMKPHKGKVVLVDFWNTWCGPCIGSIRKLEPEKVNYKSEDVAFVYLADESSPEKRWKEMISSIAGDHHRLNKEQILYLRNKFGITGIPFYLIFNKEGEQVPIGSRIYRNVLDEELSK